MFVEAKILSTTARMFSLLNAGGTLCLLKLKFSLPMLACKKRKYSIVL